MRETLEQGMNRPCYPNGPVHRMGQAGQTEMCGQEHHDGHNDKHPD